MKHERHWPADAWHFDFDVPVSLSDRYGEFIAIGGTVALDRQGRTRTPERAPPFRPSSGEG